MKTSVTLSAILNAAASLFDEEELNQVFPLESEYARGVCELIGRIRLDEMGKGCGTGENATLVRELLVKRISHGAAR